ncbi:HPr kinase/phosphorylase [Consotaella aegiceratis]|uniref:HPr kinase/phosphorylase n=1 Tax=Consotaella aegiceratis TaxID=3097961 RepID=UPI002F400CBB
MTAPDAAPFNIHACALVVAKEGVLIRGAARSGKSSLVLTILRRAEALGLRCGLIADDQVRVRVTPLGLEATCPVSIKGLIEVSGVGILRQPTIDHGLLSLVVDLLPLGEIERLPDAPRAEIAGVRLPRITLPARQASFAADVVLTVLAADPSWSDAG